MREGTLTMSHEAAYRTINAKDGKGEGRYNPRHVFKAKELKLLAMIHNALPGRNHTITGVIVHAG